MNNQKGDDSMALKFLSCMIFIVFLYYLFILVKSVFLMLRSEFRKALGKEKRDV